MELLALLGLVLVLLGVLALIGLLHISLAAAIVLLVIGAALLLWGGRGYYGARRL